MKKKKTTLPLFLTLLFTTLSMLLVNSHEMWKDELQAWMLSRDSVSIKELFTNLKYEGHPGLWHLMLFPITRIFDYPAAMQYLHVFIAAGSAFLIFKFSPFSTLQKILICLGYFLFYEYSLIARNYAIGVFFIFSLCSLFPKRMNYPITCGCILFLLSHTSVFGLIFAICFLLTILLEEVFSTRSDSARQYFSFSCIVSIIIAVLGFVLAIIQILPPIDSGFATEWRFYPSLYGFQSAAAALVGSYFPIPNFSLTSWNSQPLLLSNIPIAATAIFFAMCAVYVLARFLIERPSAFFLYLLASTGYLMFFYVKFSGALRHHGFLFITLISALWIYRHCQLRKFISIPNLLTRISKKNLNYVLNLLFIIHFLAASIAVVNDFKFPFSAAKQTAVFFRENGLSKSQIIGHTAPSASAVAGYLNKIKFYYIEIDKHGTFIRWDNLPVKKVNFTDLVSKSLEFISKNKDKDVILLLNYDITEYSNDKYMFKKIFESQSTIIRNEKFYVYRFNN